MAMGFPLSPVLSNIYMKEFEEERWIHVNLSQKCGVNDTFIIWPQGKEEINRFFLYLKDLQESIKFTMELEMDSTISFLDVLVHKHFDGILRTTVYKKPTHTGLYLHFHSNQPHNVKMGVAECLYNRPRDVYSDDGDRED
ncbi:hypothetical protein Trydic_g20507 [Trypoxylus dichotomus]